MLGPFRYVHDNVPEVWQKFPNQLNDFIDQLVQDLKDTSPTLVFLQNGQTTEWLGEYKFSQRSLQNYEKIGEENYFTIYKKKGCDKLGEMRLFFPVAPK